jgi:hypothetical protein
MTNTNDAPRYVNGRLDFTHAPSLGAFIGKSLASFVSGNRMPCMSGDDRERIPEHIRRQYDGACESVAAEILAAQTTAAPRSPAPLGWRVVPEEPTEAMLDAVKPWPNVWPAMAEATPEMRAAFRADRMSAASSYRAMLSALPVDGGLGSGSSSPKSDDTQPVAETAGVVREAIQDHAGGAAAPGVDLATFIALRLTARQKAENCKLGGDAEGVDQGAQPNQESGHHD